MNVLLPILLVKGGVNCDPTEEEILKTRRPQEGMIIIIEGDSSHFVFLSAIHKSSRQTVKPGD